MRPIDADEFMEQYNLKDATKYGNKDAKQQNHSYSTLYLYELADMIDDAPTIDIYGKWIPCSERLPKQGEQIIGTFDNGNGKIIVSQENFFTQLLKKPYPLVAWMPLPEPYKGE
jgi:hypothetical protein